MAHRRVSRRFVSRKKPVWWDNVIMNQVSLPAALLLDENVSVDGGFSGTRRWTSQGDVTIRRMIGSAELRFFSDNPPAATTVVTICLAIGIADSTTDLDGLAVNTILGVGSGPIDDASNSRWMLRCCFDIPLGELALIASTENLTWSPIPGTVIRLWGSGGAVHTYHITCGWDTNVMRKLHGQQTQWVNTYLQMKLNGVLVAAEDLHLEMNSFANRMLLSETANG